MCVPKTFLSHNKNIMMRPLQHSYNLVQSSSSVNGFEDKSFGNGFSQNTALMNTAEPGLVGALTILIPLISLKFWDKSDETGIFIWIDLEVSVIYSVVEMAENSFMIKVGRAFYFKVMANHSECMDKDHLNICELCWRKHKMKYPASAIIHHQCNLHWYFLLSLFSKRNLSFSSPWQCQMGASLG